MGFQANNKKGRSIRMPFLFKKSLPLNEQSFHTDFGAVQGND